MRIYEDFNERGLLVRAFNPNYTYEQIVPYLREYIYVHIPVNDKPIVSFYDNKNIKNFIAFESEEQSETLSMITELQKYHNFMGKKMNIRGVVYYPKQKMFRVIITDSANLEDLFKLLNA